MAEIPTAKEQCALTPPTILSNSHRPPTGWAIKFGPKCFRFFFFEFLFLWPNWVVHCECERSWEVRNVLNRWAGLKMLIKGAVENELSELVVRYILVCWIFGRLFRKNMANWTKLEKEFNTIMKWILSTFNYNCMHFTKAAKSVKPAA